VVHTSLHIASQPSHQWSNPQKWDFCWTPPLLSGLISSGVNFCNFCLSFSFCSTVCTQCMEGEDQVMLMNKHGNCRCHSWQNLKSVFAQNSVSKQNMWWHPQESLKRKQSGVSETHLRKGQWKNMQRIKTRNTNFHNFKLVYINVSDYICTFY
jgi:hypothetical protein